MRAKQLFQKEYQKKRSQRNQRHQFTLTFNQLQIWNKVCHRTSNNWTLITNCNISNLKSCILKESEHYAKVITLGLSGTKRTRTFLKAFKFPLYFLGREVQLKLGPSATYEPFHEENNFIFTRNVSKQIRLRSPCRLTRANTFRLRRIEV